MRNYNSEIWEGWTIQNFIDELDLVFGYKKFNSKLEVFNWCKDEQPYYKKNIPEVSNYFIKKAGF